MFHLRTCAATLRPLTASQAVRTLCRARPAAARALGQTRCYTAPVAAEPFLSGTSCGYVEEMYYAWLEDPKSVHKVGPRAAGDVAPRVQTHEAAGHRTQTPKAGGWR